MQRFAAARASPPTNSGSRSANRRFPAASSSILWSDGGWFNLDEVTTQHVTQCDVTGRASGRSTICYLIGSSRARELPDGIGVGVSMTGGETIVAGAVSHRDRNGLRSQAGARRLQQPHPLHIPTTNATATTCFQRVNMALPLTRDLENLE